MPNPTPPQGSRRPVAYLNEQFLNSPDARAMRILAEFLEPLAHFRREKIRDTVVFFGSARLRENGPLKQYYDDARTLAILRERSPGSETHRTLGLEVTPTVADAD
jgi:hypothetical protein